MTVNVWSFVFSKTNPARTLQPISSNCTLIHKSRYADRIFDAIQSNNVELFSRLNLYKPKKRFSFFSGRIQMNFTWDCLASNDNWYKVL